MKKLTILVITLLAVMLVGCGSKKEEIRQLDLGDTVVYTDGSMDVISFFEKGDKIYTFTVQYENMFDEQEYNWYVADLDGNVIDDDVALEWFESCNE